MNNMFNAFLPVTLWSSAIILAVLIIRKLFSHKLSAWVFKAAWLCLAVRLILPFDFAVKNAPIAVPLPSEMYVDAPVQHTAAAPNAGIAAGTFTPSTALPEAAGKAYNFSLERALPAAWLLGAALFFSAELISYCFFAARLRKTRQRLDVLNASPTSKVPVYISHNVSSPVLCGYFRPAVYLPGKLYSAKEQENIIQHEMTHYKQGDLWFQLLLLGAASLSWFNPLVHIMRRKAICDIEMTVDEKMLKNADMQQRIVYGQMLFAEISTREGLLMAQYNSGKGTKERFKAILSTTVKKRGRILLCAVIALCAGISLMVSCAPKPAPQSDAASPAISPAITAPPQSLPQSTASRPPEAPSSNSADTPAFVLPLAEYTGISRTHLTTINNIGIDIMTPKNTPVLAVMNGTVEEAVSDNSDKENWELGNYVKINHGGGIYTIYAHCTEVKVEKGSTVKPGDVIATVGSTGISSGNHLCFSVQTEDNELYFAKILELTPEEACDYVKDNVYKRELTEEEIKLWTSLLEGIQIIVK